MALQLPCLLLLPLSLNLCALTMTEAALLKPLPTLREQLVRHVLVPLGCIGMLSAAASMLVANTFTQKVFDRSMLDDAYAIASYVRQDAEGNLLFELDDRQVRAVLFDRIERVQFAVYAQDGRLLAGTGLLKAAALELHEGDNSRVDDLSVQGQQLRAVRLRMDQPGPFDVVIAQTVRERTAVLRSVLLYACGSQLVLLVVMAWWLRRVIGKQLQPLTVFRAQLDARDGRDLNPAPVPASNLDLQGLGLTVNNLLARIAASVRAQQEFAGNVSHELRTPLAGIRALAAYGLAHDDPAVWREQLRRIAQSEARASHLVDQLLALAIADETREAIVPEPVDLSELVRDLVLRNLARADKAGVDLGAVGLDQSVQVSTYPLLIDGVLSNLIDNALRYGRPVDASIQPRLTIALQKDAAVVSITVEDNGPGMDEEFRRQALERWVQGRDGQRLGEGAGLGLAIVLRYCELLGATFDVTPPGEERGFSATVALPLNQGVL